MICGYMAMSVVKNKCLKDTCCIKIGHLCSKWIGQCDHLKKYSLYYIILTSYNLCNLNSDFETWDDNVRYLTRLSRPNNSQSIQQSKFICGILIAHNKATYLIGPMRLESCGGQTHLKSPLSKQRVQMAKICY